MNTGVPPFLQSSNQSPTGGTVSAGRWADVARRVAERRRRRELLEAYFSPVVSQAAMPSAVDRLILWRSRHGCHRD